MNKTIFFITIDIYKYEKTASERGKLKFVEILEKEIIQEIKTSKFLTV